MLLIFTNKWVNLYRNFMGKMKSLVGSILKIKAFFFTCVFFLLFFSVRCYAQNIFQKTYGGAKSDGASFIIQCKEGGYAVLGTTYSFGVGDADLYLIRIDYSGNILWSKTYGGSGKDESFSVQQTADSGFIIAARTTSFNLFGTTAYVIKTDKKGNVIWSNVYPSGEFFNGSDIRQIIETSSHNYLMAGFSDVGAAFLVYINSSGGIIWTNSIGSIGQEPLIQIQEMNDGNFIGAGFTNGIGSGDYDGWLMKISKSDGNVMWNKTYGSAGEDLFYSVSQTKDNGFIVGGFTGSFSVSGDMLLVKTDSAGNVQWSKTYGSASGNETYANVRETSNGDLAIAGWTNGFGAGDNDLLLFRTNASGNVKWAKTFGTGLSEFGNAVCLTSDGGFIMAGRSDSLGVGNTDIYIVKMDSLGMAPGCHTSSPSLVVNAVTVSVSTGGTQVKRGSSLPVSTIVTNPTTIDGDVCQCSMGVSVSSSPADCGLNNGTATANTSGGASPYTYQWNTSPVQTSNQATGLLPGYYYVTVSDTQKCKVSTKVIVGSSGGSLPASVLITASATHICAGETISFTAMATNGGANPTFQWKVNNNNEGINSNLFTGNSFSNNDVIICEMTSSESCAIGSPATSNPVTIIVDESPTAGIITALRDTICSGTPGFLSVTGNSSDIQWQSSLTNSNFTNIPNATGSSFTDMIEKDTYYRVFTVNGNCSDTSEVFKLVVKPSPIAYYTYTINDLQVYFNSAGSSGDITVFTWDFNDGKGSNDSNPIHTYDSKKIYHVCLSVINGSNCSYTICRDVELVATGITIIPDVSNIAIHPNPFSNDFIIDGTNLELPIAKIEVYNLLGIRIYSTTTQNYNNQTMIDLSGFSSGVYWLKIKTTGGKYIIQRIIKL